MAHFAQIDENNNVINILVVPDEQEHRGQEYLSVNLGLGGRWIQTSYNTHGGVHTLGGTPLRKNYAGIGMKYDSARDAFISEKPYASWVLDEATCRWEAPVPMPSDAGTGNPSKIYRWDEDTTNWVQSNIPS